MYFIFWYIFLYGKVYLNVLSCYMLLQDLIASMIIRKEDIQFDICLNKIIHKIFLFVMHIFHFTNYDNCISSSIINLHLPLFNIDDIISVTQITSAFVCLMFLIY